MIQGIAYKITKYMSKLGVLSESFSIHQYGVEVILSTGIDIILILIIGGLSNLLNDSILYALFFWILRKFCGGYHCQTYLKCILLHCFIFGIYVLTHMLYDDILVLIIPIVMVVFIVFSPIKNRNLENKQYRLYKKISIIILLIYILIASLTQFKSIITYVILIISMLILVCIKEDETKII